MLVNVWDEKEKKKGETLMMASTGFHTSTF